VRSTGASLVVIGLLLAVAVALQVWRDRGWQPYEPATPVMWLEDPEVARRLALGFDALAADVYWIRAVVYFGQQRLSTREDRNYDLLYPLLNLVTALDHRFRMAYRFGSVFLAEPPPGGPGRGDLAIRLLQRGVERNPDRWEYPHDIGFVYYWSERNYQEAAKWFERGATVPGAPFWLRSTAAAMLARGGDRDSARLLWRQMRDSTEAGWLKNTADVHLAQFDAMDQIDQLNELVWQYKARTGRMPHSWQELIAARVIRRVPLDPTGVPYEIDQVNEAVGVAKHSPLWPMPEALP
jgi:tetratricopeptide (TPR) repeat protein